MKRLPMIALAIIAIAAQAALAVDSPDTAVINTLPWSNGALAARASQIDEVLGALLPPDGRFSNRGSTPGDAGLDARFKLDSGWRTPANAGLEYRSALVSADGELPADINAGDSEAAASLIYTPDDYWTFHGAVNTSANESPLQARLAGGNGRRESGGVIWQGNEWRSAAFTYAHMKFSDNNRRATARARWSERLVAGPVYSLEVTGAIYASRNSLADTPYFNPSSDFSPTLEVANEWVQWQRHNQSFRHRVVLAAGNYWQQGFGSGTVAGAYYEQQWDADDDMTFRYGLGYSLQPYDGRQTTHNYAYLSMNWRF